jgi:hypothetical protein
MASDDDVVKFDKSIESISRVANLDSSESMQAAK